MPMGYNCDPRRDGSLLFSHVGCISLTLMEVGTGDEGEIYSH